MKENFHHSMQVIIDGLSKEKRPKLLLHCCCGPCSTAVIERLQAHFEITLYFFNPNIEPFEEYSKRLETLREYLIEARLNLPVVVGDYDSAEYNSVVEGAEFVREGGDRCKRCIAHRLKKTAEYAKANGYDYFASTLSVSPHKDAEFINETGRALEKALGVAYLINDFKKADGYKRSIELSREYALYRQDYCGCTPSLNERRQING